MTLTLLDAFCCAGGAGYGYHLAGFEVVGVDIAPQPRYPFEFIQGDAMKLLADRGFLAQFDGIHASCPCQAYTNAQRIRKNTHPDLLGPVRDLLEASGRPWVIENVPGAPMRDPVELCGAMFPGLKVYRHRWFESNVAISAPMDEPEHRWPLRKMGRPPQPGEFMHVVGNFSGVAQAREAMGIGWMTRDELREAIPPSYTSWVGGQVRAAIEGGVSSPDPGKREGAAA